ncbi:TetR family transcriptional regulator [Pseudoclavibacter endophyticus]|uniref:TetR/AcrR family transcriptional regulator n=1 Tax=Pseudoclavibacter endophyticus TaxID=1778590 RepID=A0A6H9WF61_9MICO|nr:TetR/AcrR family transcriptional regulator [Pseudoclavibacter endophyticus]KAB1649542.1 TetR/AcrR family transcriptional regulator [Pseudoclavibacter endophyticus]GGA61769.1 TetR family transcriptional regulator [Pseudoclavibacter endophyticus]
MSDHTPAAERTRRAIVEAGIAVLAANPGASIGEIAAKAAVSRSTFHRYFSDKAALKKAAADLAAEAWHTAVERARLAEGTGLEAYRRLCTELLDRLPALVWWMSNDGSEDAPSRPEDEDETDRKIAAMLRRGHEDGSIDAQLSVEWISNSVWAVLYAVYFIPAETHGRLSGFEVRQQALRTLLKAAAADPVGI